jgi:peptidoglycan hydrolase CwlO-like protein
MINLHKKTKMQKQKRSVIWQKLTSAWAISLAGIIILGVTPLVHADSSSSIQQQINNLNAQDSQTQQSINALQLQASSYSNAISQLQTQINDIEQAIAASTAEQTLLDQEIQADNVKIAQQKVILGEDIKAQYVDGNLTTIEMLATSKSLSDFVDTQVYQESVADQIQQTLTQISNLENQQKDQEQQVSQLLKTQQAQQQQLASSQAQQNQLLSLNQSQQSQYNQQIASNQAQISSLKAQQAAINNQYAISVTVPPSGGSGGACDIGQGNGGYPSSWCSAPMDSILDSNGIQNRECTSFAYWYFTTVLGNQLTVSGNAGQWWATANRPVDQTPAVGAIGVEPEDAAPHYSPFGHVMIVLALPGTTYGGSLPYTGNASGISVPSGDVLVMSMNENEEGDFMYNLWPANTLYYIH